MDLQGIANTAARLMQNLLRRQAPRKTGALRSSITVTGRATADGISFTTDYMRYGIYTNKGTGPYYTEKIGQWNPRPGKGKGGIKPRFWTAIDTMTKSQVAKLLREGLKKQVINEITKK
jgi:hypothetical protein